MTTYKIDLASRYKNAFGYLAKNFDTKVINVGNESKFTDVKTFLPDIPMFDSIIMTCEGLPLVFGSAPMANKIANTALSAVFAPPPMLSFTRAKNIKETFIDGSDGVVVENYGMKPWSIKMQGILIDTALHQYPAAQVMLLTKMFEKPSRVEVIGALFADKGIDAIYFTSVNIEGVEGFPDTLKYTLQAKSIKAIEFEL